MKNPFTYLALVVIRFYQLFISPFLPPACRFFPSCSVYAYTSFKQFGFFLGMMLTTKRLLKCQPFHKGGFDPVPHAKKDVARGR